MTDTILILVGSAIVLYAVYFYCRDCKGNVSATMGGDMSFSAYWVFGTVPLLLGLFSKCGLSRWWTLAAIAPVYILSFPLRALISHLVCVPFQEEPTGFRKFIRKVESRENCQPSVTADDIQPPASRSSTHDGWSER